MKQNFNIPPRPTSSIAVLFLVLRQELEQARRPRSLSAERARLLYRLSREATAREVEFLGLFWLVLPHCKQLVECNGWTLFWLNRPDQFSILIVGEETAEWKIPAWDKKTQVLDGQWRRISWDQLSIMWVQVVMSYVTMFANGDVVGSYRPLSRRTRCNIAIWQTW